MSRDTSSFYRRLLFVYILVVLPAGSHYLLPLAPISHSYKSSEPEINLCWPVIAPEVDFSSDQQIVDGL